jgi:hypothetical protein
VKRNTINPIDSKKAVRFRPYYRLGFAMTVRINPYNQIQSMTLEVNDIGVNGFLSVECQ